MSAFPNSSHVIERLGWVLVHSLWQFALIALLAAATVRLLRRSSPNARHGVLGLALVAIIVVPAATWALMPIASPTNPAGRTVVEVAPPTIGDATIAGGHATTRAPVVVDATELAADRGARDRKLKDLEKLIASRAEAIRAGNDPGRLDLNIAVERVRLAELRLRIAAAENQKRPGSTPEEALQAFKRETLVRWGRPVMGVQIGLERVSTRDTYFLGEVVEFRRRVRNTKSEMLKTTLRYSAGDGAKSRLFSDRRFTVRFSGSPQKTMAIELQPGADQPIADSEFHIKTDNVEPGKYYVESYDRFVLGDSPDSKRPQAASSPGWTQIPRDIPLTFFVTAPNDAASGPAEVEPYALQGSPEIAWGSPVQGLQAGLRYTRGLVKPAEFSDPENWQWKLGDTVQAEFVVRNVNPTVTPVTFAITNHDQLVELNTYTHSVQVYEFGGALMRRRSKSGVARSEGYEPTDRERTVQLQPGGSIVIARTAFQLLELPKEKADIAKLPRVDAILVEAGGRYSFRSRLSVRSTIASELRLSTGQTRLWLPDADVSPAEPIPVATQGSGRITLQYDMPGSTARTEFVIQSRSASGRTVVTHVTNGEESPPIELSAGQYEVFRRISLSVGSWQKEVLYDRHDVTVAAGKELAVRFVRPRERLVSAKGQWPELAAQSVGGAFLTVHPIDEKNLGQGDPDTNFDFEIDRHTVCATTCGPDGRFSLEPLPPGRYAVVLRAFREPASDGGGVPLPGIVDVETFYILGHSDDAHFYPNEFHLRKRWNTPQWLPTRVAQGNASIRPPRTQRTNP